MTNPLAWEVSAKGSQANVSSLSLSTFHVVTSPFIARQIAIQVYETPPVASSTNTKPRQANEIPLTTHDAL